MSHWNHRTVRHVHSRVDESGVDEVQRDYPYMTVHEVYYDDKELPFLWSPQPASPRGKTQDEGKADAERIGRAFDKEPVVEVDDATITWPEDGWGKWKWLVPHGKGPSNSVD